jgi:hypothetical protein
MLWMLYMKLRLISIMKMNRMCYICDYFLNLINYALFLWCYSRITLPYAEKPVHWKQLPYNTSYVYIRIYIYIYVYIVYEHLSKFVGHSDKCTIFTIQCSFTSRWSNQHLVHASMDIQWQFRPCRANGMVIHCNRMLKYNIITNFIGCTALTGYKML